LSRPRRCLIRFLNSFFAISNERDGVVYYSRCNFSRSPRPLIPARLPYSPEPIEPI